jgi:hypothetical protein
VNGGRAFVGRGSGRSDDRQFRAEILQATDVRVASTNEIVPSEKMRLEYSPEECVIGRSPEVHNIAEISPP